MTGWRCARCAPTWRPTRSRSCPSLVWIADELGAGWAVLAAALIALPHLVVDDGRIVRLYLARVKRAPEFDVGLAASVDQSFHVLSLFLVAILLGAA